jgi:hypothetical protein
MNIPLPDVTLPQVLQRLLAAAVVSGVYGYVAALVASMAGERGPTYDGRRTVNPLVHADIVGVLAAIFFRVTWLRPMELDTKEMRSPRLGALVVVLAGPLAMAALAVLATLARRLVVTTLPLSAAVQATSALAAVAEVAVATGLVGLLPLPPLLGGLWWAVVAPGAERWARDRRVLVAGYVVVAALLMTGLLDGPIRWAWRSFFGLLGY